jgi:hypothetical protein
MASTTKETFVDHGVTRPRSPAGFAMIEHVIIPTDDLLTVKKSSNRADFVHHRKPVRSLAVNNSLQESHLQFASGAKPQWSTTQQDYFQWQRFKFD